MLNLWMSTAKEKIQSRPGGVALPTRTIMRATNLVSNYRVCKQQTRRKSAYYEVARMLWTLFIVLMVLWLLGLVSSFTLGGFIHVLLALAVIALVVQLLYSNRNLEA